MGREAGQHVAQPSLGIDVVALGGLDQGVNRGGSRAAVVGSSEEGGLAAERQGPDAPLGSVVVGLQVAIAAGAGPARPRVQGLAVRYQPLALPRELPPTD